MLGFKKRKNKDWFDESDQEISKLLQEKHRLHERLLRQGVQGNTSVIKDYKEYKAALQRELRGMKNTWWSNKSSEILSASDGKDLKTIFELLHQVFSPSSSSIVPLK